MAVITLGGSTIHTHGDLPKVGQEAPEFTLVNDNLENVSLEQFKGKYLLLNIFPSLDTRVCATSVRKFNEEAANLPNVSVLCVSNDLPFAMKRFCVAENISNVKTLSDFRFKTFGKDYGVEITDGAFAGLHARAVVVIDPKGIVRHTELVPEIGEEPDYSAALQDIQN